MRHLCQKHKIGVDSKHQKSLLRNLASAVITHGKIKTTHTKCLAARRFVEKLVTIARKDTLANRRLVLSKLDDKKAVSMLFKDVAPKYADRKGGYTRIVKLADPRVGDSARVSILSFV